MNLCVTEELRGGNECFYRLPAAAVDTENWKALVETKTRVSSKADEEAKKKNVRLNKWSGITTFCILNSVLYGKVSHRELISNNQIGISQIHSQLINRSKV